MAAPNINTGAADPRFDRPIFVVNPPRSGVLREWRYDDQKIVLKQGEEMGRFLLGSTVVMLFPASTLKFNEDWSPTRPVQMGEMMAARA